MPPNQSDVLDACVNTHEAACWCMFWHVSTYLCVHIVWVWACTRACKCLCVSVSVSPCFCLCVCAHTWMHACACVCVSMHAHSVCVSEKEVQQGICWPLVTHRERERWAMGHRGWVALWLNYTAWWVPLSVTPLAESKHTNKIWCLCVVSRRANDQPSTHTQGWYGKRRPGINTTLHHPVWLQSLLKYKFWDQAQFSVVSVEFTSWQIQCI